MEQLIATVLTEKQQRVTLSGKKKKKKERRGHTVFASPYDAYWLVYCLVMC
jgi:hypothetical protein